MGCGPLGQSTSAGMIVHRVLYFENAHGLIDIGSEGAAHLPERSGLDRQCFLMRSPCDKSSLNCTPSVVWTSMSGSPSLPYCWKTMARVPIKRKKMVAAAHP